ncbi:MAG TPA: dienelactone hydrolase family protein [Fimbriimonadaceae bacterium]|nr:dienelactone hydrolase family protein [Fimbriimonadaceae bacterium]
MPRLAFILVGAALAVGASAKIVTKNVEYSEGGTSLEGFLAYDDSAQGKRPVVIVVHDWNSIDDYERSRCEMLAKLGYVAFAADIYGKSVRPKNASESAQAAGKFYGDNALLRSRLDAAIAQAKKLPHADSAKMAMIGYCFGGACALEAARMGAALLGAVSFHGSLRTTNPAKPGTVKAKVLVLHGDADPLVPKEQVEAFKKEMADAKVDLTFIGYPGAVHSFTIKGSEAAGNPAVAYNAEADTQSWEAMKRFFDAIFK